MRLQNILISRSPWQKENRYRAAFSRWWGDSAVALHSDLTSEGIPLPQGVPNQTLIHGLNGAYDLASFLENSAGTQPLQGNQVGRKPKMDMEFFMAHFNFSGSIFP